MQTGKVATNAKRHFSIYQNMPHRNSNFFYLDTSSQSLLGTERSVACFCPAYWVKYNHQQAWGMKEIVQACGFCCIVRFTAFSSSRGAHKKARVTPLSLCRSRPTLIPHPSDEGLLCTQGETTISFATFGHYCQSWQLRSWEEIKLWLKSLIEISEISIKYPPFFFFFFFSLW